MITLRKQNFLSICIQEKACDGDRQACKSESSAEDTQAPVQVSQPLLRQSSALSPKLLELQLFQLLNSLIHSKSEHGLIIFLSSF